MQKHLVRSALCGGIVVFLWYMISWMVLPMHTGMVKRFNDEQKVRECLYKETAESGIYLIPPKNLEHAKESKSIKGAAKKVKREFTHNNEEGSFFFVNVGKSHVISGMTGNMIIGLITQIIGAFVVCYLLMQTKLTDFMHKVWFITVIGVVVALLGVSPAWNWWHFPSSWVIFEMLDIIIGWFLGGLVIAKLSQGHKAKNA